MARGINSKKPSNEDVDKVQAEGGDNKTPGLQGSHMSIIKSSDDEEPYVTPFLLEKKIQKVVTPPPDNTEAEDSEIKNQLRGKANKKTGVVRSSSNKVS